MATSPAVFQVGQQPTASQLNSHATAITELQSAAGPGPVAYSPILTGNTTNPSGYTATGRWIKTGKLVYYWFFITLGSSVGSGYYLVSLPTNANPSIANQGLTGSGPGVVQSSGFTAVQGQWDIYTAATAILRVPSSLTALVNASATSPLALSAGSTLGGQIIYEAQT